MRSAAFRALGTSVTLVTADESLAAGRALLERELRRLDETCSRFRSDSELARANARAGETVSISPLLAELIALGLHAAEASGGRVDPTLGAELRAAGYDQTFALVQARERWMIAPAARPRVHGWQEVTLDAERLTLRAPPGTELDLGATAKAWAADEAAAAIARSSGSGALVSLGGDIAVAGASPHGGWPIRIANDHAASPERPGPVVAITTGGVATSSTSVRRWQTNLGEAHHILDPTTGRPAAAVWRVVSVAGATCVEANIAATAAVVLGEHAPAWLEQQRLPARLERVDGATAYTCGWPADERLAA